MKGSASKSMNTTGRRIESATVTAAIVVAAGCGGAGEGALAESVAGQWFSVEAIDESHNELVLDEGGEGEATVYIHRTVNNMPEASPFDFEVAWEAGEETGEEIHLELTCTSSPFGACEPDDDILMECDLSPGMTMSCEAEGRWRDYAFRWQKA